MSFFPPLVAILRRDAITAWSYRLDFVLKGFSAFFSVVLWFYMAKFISASGAKPSVGDYFAYLVVGTALMGYVNVVLFTFSNKLRQEKVLGTLEMLLASPSSAYGVMWASAAWELFYQTVQVLLFLFFAALLGVQFKFGSIAALFLVAALFLASTAAIGIIAASMLLIFQRGEPVTPFIGALFALLGNVFFPADVLPQALQLVSRAVPLPYALDAVREIALGGAGFSQVSGKIYALSMFCAVLVPSSYVAFGVCLRFSRKYGLLAQY